MKKRFIRIVIVLGILAAVALAVVWFSLDSIVKKGVETIGPELTQVEVRLASVNLSPLSGRGHLSGFFVGNPTGFQTPSALTMGDVQIHLNVGSVLSDTVVIESLRVQAPEITFEGSLTGQGECMARSICLVNRR